MITRGQSRNACWIDSVWIERKGQSFDGTSFIIYCLSFVIIQLCNSFSWKYLQYAPSLTFGSVWKTFSMILYDISTLTDSHFSLTFLEYLNHTSMPLFYCISLTQYIFGWKPQVFVESEELWSWHSFICKIAIYH